MILQNRVDPLGAIVATPHRGALMGNRGGRLHRPDKTLGARRWASKSWIACKTDFRGRRREVMGAGYTELFFLDEATALAAGHRPCFECRRRDALSFAEAWGSAKGLDAPPRAAEMDAALHAERIERRARRGPHARRLRGAALDDAPVGAIVMAWGGLWLVAEHYLLRWRFSGYDVAIDRGSTPPTTVAFVTPPSVLAALRAGYRPAVDSALF